MTRSPNHDEEEAALFDLPLHRPATPVARRAPSPATDDAADEPFGPVVETPAVAAPPQPAVPQTTSPASAPIVPDPAATPAPTGTRSATGTGTGTPVPHDATPQISFAMTLPFEEKQPGEESEVVSETTGAAEPVRAGFGSRLVAGLIDLTLIVGGVALAAIGAVLLGVPPRIDDWPAFLVLGLTFSFLYYVIPLAFWGRSGGMAVKRLFVRSNDGRPLSFRQAAQRWLAALLTLATLGLPTLLALTPRSFADRLSRSRTFAR